MFDVDAIKGQIDILKVVGADENLTEHGGQWFGAHPKKHESKGKQCLAVHPVKQKWYCFHCQIGGDVFNYVMDRDGCSFMEAVRSLCDTFQITLPNLSPEEKAKIESDRKERKSVRDVMMTCFKWYHDTMKPEHRDYFRGRGISDEIIDDLLLGYAPDGGRALIDYLLSQLNVNNGNVEEMRTLVLGTGLFFKADDGRLKDRYVDRFIFPYWKGEDIVFSIGRTINKSVEAQKKYVKHLTPSNYPFVSAVAVEHVIWGMDTVRGASEIIVTEGIIDAILAYQAGFPVLSPVTTQFKDHHVEALVKLTGNAKTVYIINDNEINHAGYEGAWKTAAALFAAGRDARLVELPRPDGVDKIDLADFLNVPDDRHDAQCEELRRLMKLAPDFIEVRIVEASKLAGREQTDALKEIAGLLASLDDASQERYLDRLAILRVVSRNALKNMVRQAKIEKAKEEKAQRMAELKDALSPAGYLKVQIVEARKSKYLQAFEVKRRVSALVMEDMGNTGRYYQVPITNQMYWFDNASKELYRLGEEKFARYCNARYGVNPSEIEYEFLLQDLYTECDRIGTETQVYQFSHYGDGVLYVDNNANQVYRLDGNEVALVDNGSDGILFLNQALHETFEYRAGCKDLFWEVMVKPINFANGDGVAISVDEQRALFWLWTYSMFFGSLQPTRPIQFFLGPKGSGKTTRQRMVGRWLFGKWFDLISISKEREGDFVTAITNNSFVAFDNVDSAIPWLPDHLARLATGGKISKRELYTTNKEVSYFPKCFVSLNAREPKFKRDDVTERLLIFRLARMTDFTAESRMMERVTGHRDELWSEHLDGLNRIVGALKSDQEEFSTSFRMADFAEFGWRVMKLYGKGDYFLSLLNKMDQAQSDFLMEDNALFECLSEWLNDAANGGREVRTSELYEELKAVADAENIGFNFKSSITLGKALRQMLPDLRKYFIVLSELKKKSWVYTFSSLKT